MVEERCSVEVEAVQEWQGLVCVKTRGQCSLGPHIWSILDERGFNFKYFGYCT